MEEPDTPVTNSGIWGLGLQGVVVCLASRKSDGFNSHKFHAGMVYMCARLDKIINTYI